MGPSVSNKASHKHKKTLAIFFPFSCYMLENMETPPLLIHLHKLPPATPEESLAEVIETLWKTRKSGLSSIQKSHVESILNLPAPIELEPVLASLRLIIRKVSKEKLNGNDILKLLPVDLSGETKKTLVATMQKYQNCLEEEPAGDQLLSQQTRMTFPCRVNTLPEYADFQVSDLSSWPREDDTRSCLYGVKSGCSISNSASTNPLQSASVLSLNNCGSSYNPATLPRLQLMTWTMEKRDSVPGNRLSIVNLKLQDYTKSHLGEVEVKFQLSRDTLEAMLRSMSYINDQLSDSERLQPELTAKGRKQ